MKFVSTFLLFFGYMLVYAAVAASGKFATEPWASLFADAYTEAGDPKVKSRDAVPTGPPGVVQTPGSTGPGKIPRFRAGPGGAGPGGIIPPGTAIHPGR